jgi:hypothetical protein
MYIENSRTFLELLKIDIQANQVLSQKAKEKQERTTDHGQATGKLYHLRLRVACTFFFVIYKAGHKPNIGDKLV